uniref:Ketoreductase (KR) domain-containing protein n=1 Tax=Pseudo-nitzschia australis TaxID=44445 RepID=A0A7S4EMM5_9STRA|mmetsp:Transcript_4396/g.9510  ORF Transcript_4396/g.9510 Transcript_4396/m.9510 type:complete len:417 (+) Transcript_4396:110-1360(+)
MGSMISALPKAIGSSAISGYAAHRLLGLPSLTSLPLPRPARIALTGLASFAGFAYYAKVWIQDYYFDYSYNDARDLTGRTAIVTGGTVGGLGFAAAELLYKQGATVVVTVRSEEKGELAVAKLKGGNDNDGRASYVICDFLSEPSVRKCAAEIKTRCGNGIDFLVLNAGIARGSKTTKKESKDDTVAEQEAALAAKNADAAKIWMTNHVGPFVLANELMPSVVQTARRSPSEHPRVVWVSSGAHKKATIHWDNPFHPKEKGTMLVYGQSKLANIMHAREYQKRVRECLQQESDDNSTNKTNADVKCFALTPGAVWTKIFNVPTLLYPLFWVVLRTPTLGAQVIKMACLDNDLKGGEYLSNCCVKETTGKDGCSNDEGQWKRLWEVTEKQVADKEYETYLDTSTGDATSTADEKKED